MIFDQILIFDAKLTEHSIQLGDQLFLGLLYGYSGKHLINLYFSEWHRMNLEMLYCNFEKWIQNSPNIFVCKLKSVDGSSVFIHSKI